MKNIIEKLNFCLTEVTEKKESFRERELEADNYLDYLENLPAKYFKDGEQGKEKEIMVTIRSLEDDASKIGLRESEMDLKYTEDELIDYFFDHITEFKLSNEEIIDFLKEKELYYTTYRDYMVFNLVSGGIQ